jgi:hypothetical protein
MSERYAALWCIVSPLFSAEVCSSSTRNAHRVFGCVCVLTSVSSLRGASEFCHRVWRVCGRDALTLACRPAFDPGGRLFLAIRAVCSAFDSSKAAQSMSVHLDVCTAA